MKTYIVGSLIAMALLISGCHAGNKNGSSADAKDAHEHLHDHEHDHSHSHDHDHNHDHDRSSGDTDEIHFSRQQAEMVGLEVEQVAPAPFSYVIKTNGHIQAAQGDEVIIAATSNGIVSYTNPSLTDGSAVKSGQSIVTISARDLLEGDPSTKAKIEFETAEKEFHRAELLVKDQIISTKEFEQSRLRYETAKTAYNAQASNMTAHGVRVTSPINGYIKNRMVGQGEYVSVGQPIATVSQNKRLQLRAELSESHYKTLKNITSANFKPAYDDQVYQLSDLNGRLLSFGRSADGQSFFIPVTFEFDNVGDFLPGAFTEVYLLASPKNDVISVPTSSLTEEQGLYFVYLQFEEEHYKKQEVTPGQSDGTRVQIVSGLKPGDKVVTKGVYQVKLAAVSSVMPEGHTHNH
ncbi:MAG: efflux RND transporter periplasmic adaptor subunit [Proteiniphilum sp.]|jgi:cobalt-zinc-cadmium efflux system membrane fusion protein|uniref:efflux RND transporter periplasmic adaptor subunit n=1 Tax=Proteiniphilum sp. TaxID=1926877 RepID=UPI002B21D81B|nr:efflux RND transporter periplasmic adaptor subunit [Proteiniphilum sp.]MEA5127622.1 efflux RND transporter periplasmic adaptor subunit [Proteiniphilum sp.]